MQARATISSGPRPDWQAVARAYRDTRSIEQITEHYEVEIALADRLRNSDRDERSTLYTALYNELFERLPHHPQFTRRRDNESYVARQIAVLRRLLPSQARFVEVGAGDCRVSMRLASLCRSTTALDVSDRVVGAGEAPGNFRFVQTNGIDLPLPSGSADFVYSNQLMEHLHRDDATHQLAEIHRVLVPGGRYLCVTPSRLTGPHDVSRYFDREPRGFHMVEYSYQDLGALFAKAGFDGMQACIVPGGVYLAAVPLPVAIACEKAFGSLPLRVRDRHKRSKFVAPILSISLLARKPKA